MKKKLYVFIAKTPLEKANLSKALHQALIHPTIEETVLDLSTDPKFKYTGRNDGYINSDGLIMCDKTDDPLFPEQGLFIYLTNKFHAQTNNRYCDCFVVFAFNEQIFTLNAVGMAQDIGIENVILSSGRNIKTIAHECMHGLGLFHTHRNGRITNKNQKFVFPTKTTDNYMSYSGEARKTLWQWQWKILNP